MVMIIMFSDLEKDTQIQQAGIELKVFMPQPP